MRHTVRLVLDSLTFTEAYLTEWLVAVGETLTVGDSLCLIDVDKVQVEFPSPVAGVLVTQLVPPDAQLAAGVPLAVIDAS